MEQLTTRYDYLQSARTIIPHSRSPAAWPSLCFRSAGGIMGRRGFAKAERVYFLSFARDRDFRCSDALVTS